MENAGEVEVKLRGRMPFLRAEFPDVIAPSLRIKSRRGVVIASIMKLFVTLLVSGLSILVHGAEPEPLITTTGKLLLSEDFSEKEIPKTFRTLQSAASFSMAEGALQAESRAGQERSTHGVVMVQTHDLTVAFAVKFTKPGSLFVGLDGYKEEFKGNTHLCRFSLTSDRMAWDQHRGGPESKHAVSEANRAARAAKKPITRATTEQLADPHFFRIEDLTSKPVHCAADEWHHVLLEISGNELVAQMDGEKLFATSTQADSQKNRIGFGLTGRGIALIKNLRINENVRRSDWQQAKVAAATEAAPKK
jgi:hypothetical protein